LWLFKNEITLDEIQKVFAQTWHYTVLVVAKNVFEEHLLGSDYGGLRFVEVNWMK
jgi:hypothetical protein